MSDARPPRARPPELLHADEQIVIVDKPAGLSFRPDRQDDTSLIEFLEVRHKLETEDLSAAYSLDRGASGLFVCVRGRAARASIGQQMEAAEFRITLDVLVSGYFDEPGPVKMPMRHSRRSSKLEVSQQGGLIEVDYRIRERVAGNTLLTCELIRGEVDGVRAQLAHLGFPLTVDPRYGGGQAVVLSLLKGGYHPSSRREEKPLIDRLTMHVSRVRMRHPHSGAELAFEVPLAKDLRATLKQLGRLL